MSPVNRIPPVLHTDLQLHVAVTNSEAGDLFRKSGGIVEKSTLTYSLLCLQANVR